MEFCRFSEISIPSNVQWGNVGQYACDIQLPIKFPTTIFGVYLGGVSPEIGQYNEQENKLFVQEWSLYSVNNSGLSFRKIGYLGNSGKRYWIAIGY